MLISLALLLAAVAGDATSADVAAAKAPTAPAAAQPKTADGGNRVICKDGVNVTGTRVPARRRCMMKRDWDRRKQNDSDAVRALQNSSALSKVI